MRGPQSMGMELLLAGPSLRASLIRAWEQFLDGAKVADQSPEECWLLVQLVSGPQSLSEIAAALSLFVADVPALVQQCLARGQIRCASEDSSRYELTEASQQLLWRILPVAQTTNEGWRQALIKNEADQRQLQLVLSMLQGVRPSPPRYDLEATESATK